jgi:ribosomal protein S18 acetylase RimI-like enzyme
MEQTNPVNVRVATPEDSAMLAGLSANTFRETFAETNTTEDMEAYMAENFTVSAVAQQLASRSNIFLIAELSGEAVGYAKLREGQLDPSVTGTNPIELERLYVLAAHIGHRVGATLMGECLNRAASLGFQTIWLGVWEHNPRALAFYERWGFQKVGSHTFRLGDDLQNDLIMQKNLQGVLTDSESAAKLGGTAP